MANTQNLIVPSSELARENGRKGGLKKAENERKRKTLREELLLLLEKGDTQTKLSLSLIEEATKGNTKAFEVIRDTIGEKPKENISVGVSYEDYIKKVEDENEY